MAFIGILVKVFSSKKRGAIALTSIPYRLIALAFGSRFFIPLN